MESILANFPGGRGGFAPYGPLIYLDGSIFGEAAASNHGGTVFKIDRNTGAMIRLHLEPKGMPLSGLTPLNGTLYGATQFGGDPGYGTLFSLNVHDRAYSTLYNFNGADGSFLSGVMTYHNGLFYGVASIPGSVFTLNPAMGAFATIATFTGNDNGSHFNGGLVYRYGLLYGTSYEGGDPKSKCTDGCGIVYSLDPSTGKEVVLHRFAGEPDSGTPDGALIYTFGMIYGTTYYGGTANLGTVFQIDPSTGAETVLHSFAGGNDGQNPEGGLALWNGALYGTTSGGQSGLGTLFKFVP